MSRECAETLSGMHVFDPDSHRCRCGLDASPLDLAMLEQMRARVREASHITRRLASVA